MTLLTTVGTLSDDCTPWLVESKKAVDTSDEEGEDGSKKKKKYTRKKGAQGGGSRSRNSNASTKQFRGVPADDEPKNEFAVLDGEGHTEQHPRPASRCQNNGE